MADEPHVDRPFRRSLFIMLLAIGLIASAGFFYARDARNGQARAERRLENADRDRHALQKQLLAVLDNQRKADAKASTRQVQLEHALAVLLSKSSDPQVVAAVRAALTPTHRPTPTTAPPGGGRQPAPTPTRSSQPDPKPSPTHSPRPLPEPLPLPPFPVPCLPVICR